MFVTLTNTFASHTHLCHWLFWGILTIFCVHAQISRACSMNLVHAFVYFIIFMHSCLSWYFLCLRKQNQTSVNFNASSSWNKFIHPSSKLFYALMLHKSAFLLLKLAKVFASWISISCIVLWHSTDLTKKCYIKPVNGKTLNKIWNTTEKLSNSPNPIQIDIAHSTIMYCSAKAAFPSIKVKPLEENLNHPHRHRNAGTYLVCDDPLLLGLEPALLGNSSAQQRE